MKDYEIWMEGYSCTGEHQSHEFIGKVTAENFANACELAVKDWCFSEEEFKRYYDSETQTFWGRKCYDNEADSTKNFG